MVIVRLISFLGLGGFLGVRLLMATHHVEEGKAGEVRALLSNYAYQ